MKKIIGIGLIILIASCSSVFSPNQKIIMIDGPALLWSMDNYFFIGGHIQNISNQKICFVEIVIYLRDFMGASLMMGKTRAYKEMLLLNEISSWNIMFYDPGQTVRIKIDFSKVCYEINIKDSDLPL